MRHSDDDEEVISCKNAVKQTDGGDEATVCFDVENSCPRHNRTSDESEDKTEDELIRMKKRADGLEAVDHPEQACRLFGQIRSLRYDIDR